MSSCEGKPTPTGQGIKSTSDHIKLLQAVTYQTRSDLMYASQVCYLVQR